MTIQSTPISVFAESPYEGNTALVQWLEAEWSKAAMQQAARRSGAPATCFVWPRSHAGFQVYCFSPDGIIRCCGHGLLATAYVLHQQNPATKEQPIELYLPGDEQPLQAQWHAGNLWVALPRLRCTASAIPAWVDGAFSHAPLRAAVAGGVQGYLLLEYDPTVALAAIQVDFARICANTACAVIICQQDVCKNYDFLSRYFAPQYGANEDAVTGSGNRVLADYWGQKTGVRNFRALQCSPTGGVVLMRLRPQYVEISGALYAG